MSNNFEILVSNIEFLLELKNRKIIRRVVAPKSNTGRGQFARTNCSGSMERFGSSLVFYFFETPEMKIPQDQSIGMGHGLVLCEYERSPLRNKTVISAHTPCSMTPKFRELEFFENIDESEPFGGPT